MSLTRAEWEEMWKTTQKLEDCVLEGMRLNNGYRSAALRQIKKIKDQIQQVIGQME